MKQIKRVGVLGAGVMGATIAGHLANAGLDVLLLDMVPRETTEEEKARGLTLESPEVRSRPAREGLAALAKMKPSPLYLPEYRRRIETGNFADDIGRLGECDWVIEVVVEHLGIKKKLLENVAPHLAAGTVLSTNTSGLSVNEMAEVLPPQVRRRFLVTHFFNPPRYMRLVEIVPCRETDPETVERMADFLSRRLGKGIVFAKDTPNFIANRIGVYAIFKSMEHMDALGLSVEEVDAVSGPATARPKSAVFRTADLVGIDTLAHVGRNSYEVLSEDDEREVFRLPSFLKAMVEKGRLGDKVKKGFYRKEKENGKSVIYHLDYASGEYRPPQKPKFPSLAGVKQLDDPGARVKTVLGGSDPGAEFAWRSLRDILLYAVKRVPEIADDIVNIDNALRWGFNWEIGPFEMLDAIGVPQFVERARRDGVPVPAALEGVETFYKFENGRRLYFDLLERDYRPVPIPPGRIVLDILRKQGAVVEKNAGSSLLDLGDGVFCLEFHSKMNAIDADILAMTRKAIRRAEAEGVGLVVGNQGANFSAGANLMMIAGLLQQGNFEAIEGAVRAFQDATMSLKYSRVPVVTAPFNRALGGGCEYALNADAVVAHAETYMGLVEVGVGLLPAGGGTKEMALRAIRLARDYETDVSPFIFKFFQNIVMARVSTSADELYGMGYLRQGDAVTMSLDTLIADARQKVLALARTYRPRRPEEGLPAPGRSVAASIKSRLWNLREGGYATEYEATMGGIIADVITGGDVPGGTLLTETYLLELEREAFLRLCGHRQTAERIEHMLKTGKPLRN